MSQHQLRLLTVCDCQHTECSDDVGWCRAHCQLSCCTFLLLLLLLMLLQVAWTSLLPACMQQLWARGMPCLCCCALLPLALTCSAATSQCWTSCTHSRLICRGASQQVGLLTHSGGRSPGPGQSGACCYLGMSRHGCMNQPGWFISSYHVPAFVVVVVCCRARWCKALPECTASNMVPILSASLLLHTARHAPRAHAEQHISPDRPFVCAVACAIFLLPRACLQA